MATGVQESDVWAAADALLRAGEQPTIERVRLQMGRGSPNTVGPHLKAWFRALGTRLGAAGQADEAAAVPDRVHQAAQHFWEMALAAARDEWQQAIALERQALTTEQQTLAADQQALRTEQKRLDQRETDLKAAIYSAREQAAAAQDRAQSLEAQLKQSETRATGLESRLAESAERERVLLERHHEAESRHRQDLSAAEQRHASHERRWLNDLDAQRQAAKKTQDDLEQQRQLTQKARSELDQQRQDAAVQQQAQQTALDEATKALRLANDDSRALNDTLRTTTRELDRLKQALADAQRTATELEHTRQAMQAQIDASRSAAASVEESLRERLADLSQRVAEQGTQLQIKDQQIAAQAQALTQLRAPSLAPDRPTQGD